MYMRTYARIIANVFMKDQLQKILDGLAFDKPEYIFMERIYLNRDMPKRYCYRELRRIVAYFKLYL